MGTKLKLSEFRKLKKLMDSHGPVKIAISIGERDTQALHRWIKDLRVPPSKISNVKKTLSLPPNVIDSIGAQ